MEYFIDRESIHSSTFSSTDIQQSIVRVYLPSSTGSEYCTANSHLLWLLLIPIWKYIWWFSTNIQTKGWIVLLKCNWIGVSKQTSLLSFFKNNGTIVPDCNRPADPANGHFECTSSSYLEGSTCNLICDSGFVPASRTTMTCTASQTGFDWSVLFAEFRNDIIKKFWLPCLMLALTLRLLMSFHFGILKP